VSLDRLSMAIKMRAPISFEYAKTPGVRVGNPHALFVLRRHDGLETTKVDIEQTAGVSESGQPFPSWRRFDFDQLRVIAVHEDGAPFEVSSVYNPTASVYELLIAKV
jgi:hypothetical protein